ncbi:rho guanine nucleotide exchange factor 40 [Nematolebias whitei]|uniref:rho guanine nucleotide exchange factor 40 n=1 Tax=Nematolebias whitei TaxID=451745 RepID=UPI001899460D|nr:rho guanine nucleotide exchange factor 40 [Nematolebias whitei]
MKVKQDFVKSLFKEEEVVEGKQQQQLQEAKCRSKEEVEESEKIEGIEEVGQKMEVEEVQVLAQQDQKEEQEEVIKEIKKEAEKIKGCAEAYTDKVSFLKKEQKPHHRDPYCEVIKQETHLGLYYCENVSLLSHPEDSFCVNDKLLSYSADNSYCGNIKQKSKFKDSYCENSSMNSHSEDSYCENKSQNSPPGASYYENVKQLIQPENYYFEDVALQSLLEKSYCVTVCQETHSEDTYSENVTQKLHPKEFGQHFLKETCSEDFCSENKTKSKDFFCENIKQNIFLCGNNKLQSHSASHWEITQKLPLKDLCCGHILQKTQTDFSAEIEGQQSHIEKPSSEIPQQTPWENSYCENFTLWNAFNSYSEEPTQTQPEDSYSEDTKQTQPEDSCSESTEQAHAEDSYSENRMQIQLENFYSENTIQTQPQDSYSETPKLLEVSYSKKKIQTQPEDSYSENTIQKQTEESYTEDSKRAQPEDSCSENPEEIQPEGSCSENSEEIQPEDSCSESSEETQPGKSYFENLEQAQSKDSYFESTDQTHSKDSYSAGTKQTQPEDSYSENTQQTQPGDSYSESTIQKQLEESYSEGTKQTQSEDSYSESTEQIQVESFCSERAIKTQAEDCYFKSTEQPPPEDSYSENTTQTEDSYSENTTQTQAEYLYSESAIKTRAEDSCFQSTEQTQPENIYYETSIPAGDFYSETTIQKQPKDSYSESTKQQQSEDSYSESTEQPQPEDSYSENIDQTELEDFDSEGAKQSHPEVSYSETKTSQTEAEFLKCDRGQHNEEINSEEGEEHSCESGGQRSTDHQTKVYSHESPPVQSKVDMSAGTSPIEPEQPPAAPAVHFQSSHSCQPSFYSQLLRSGAVCLPGTKDRGGRAIFTVSCLNSVWLNPYCNSPELLRLLLYYTFTLRKEVRALGLTVLVDARGAAPPSALFSAFRLLQEDTPGSIHMMLILLNKESFLCLDKPASTQVEMLSSLKSLQKHVDLRQLPADFGGSFRFSQNNWISFRSRVDQLTRQCNDVIQLLQKSISILQSTPVPAAKQDAELLLSRYKAVMGSILGDIQLVWLQREGGASLSVLRREEGGDGVSEEQQAAVEEVSSLYEEVDELLHRLVTLYNAKTQELNFVKDFRNLEQDFSLVKAWLEEVGEVHLKTLSEPADSLELLNKKQQDFKDFYTTAHDHCKKGQALLARLEHWDNASSADPGICGVKVHSFWTQLQDFSQRVKSTGNNIDRAIQLYRFLDQAYEWALESMRHLAGISMEDCTHPDKCQAVIDSLEEYQQTHPPIPDARFQEMRAEAAELQGDRGLHHWTFAWAKCQETKKMFDRKMEAVLRTRDSVHRRRSDSVTSRSSISSRKSLSGLWGVQESSPCSLESDTSSPVFSASPPTPHRTSLLQRLFRSSSSFEEASEQKDNLSPSPSLTRLNSSHSFSPFFSPSFSSFSFSPLFSPRLSPSSSSSRRQHLRKTQSFDCPSTPDVLRCGSGPRTLSEPPRRGNTGVFIRGLEVSSSEAADQTLCPRMPAHSWTGPGPRSPQTPGTPAVDGHHREGSRLRHIVEEMVTTEREYVRSLRYIIHHYFPEMDRADLPQGLRGKRSVIFGNLEKLLDFHSQFFLRELEACWKHPLRVPHCFLRHEEQFSLYALYSKNKPKSDALLANHGHSFFRWKQLELEDKMDLSSYLLKPIQRMSKYALLLTDLMKEVGTEQEAELTALQAATSMVKFQLRHGNDLLAMDAIRDCDVDLKEQGQLIRQDEFTVSSGRRKCQRHIFLFEELILFSKPKKMEGGLDVFIYKHSFKTADVGLTESTGNSGLRFEIWFRRRTTKNQTFILQATTAEVKHTWTTDIARILWTQATRNKEMRLKEMVSMGVGNKPFLDIQPSDAAISDRAVHYIMKNKGARTRASIAVSVFDHSQPFKREAVTSDPAASGPSSCSLLGPLNLHMYSQLPPAAPPADSSFSSSCIEEDEQEHETSSQPSMTTESSGSSSRCLSGSTGSDSGCVSSHLQEAMLGESSPPSQPSSSSSSSSSSKQHLPNDYMSSKAATII